MTFQYGNYAEILLPGLQICAIFLSDSLSVKLFALQILRCSFRKPTTLNWASPSAIGLTPATSPWRVALSASVALLRVSNLLGFVAMS